jgi:hypothetical protein
MPEWMRDGPEFVSANQLAYERAELELTTAFCAWAIETPPPDRSILVAARERLACGAVNP